MHKINTLSLATAIVFARLSNFGSRKNVLDRFRDLGMHSDEVIKTEEEIVEKYILGTGFDSRLHIKHHFTLKCYGHEDLQLDSHADIQWVGAYRTVVLFKKWVVFKKIPVDRNDLVHDFYTLGESLFKTTSISLCSTHSYSEFFRYNTTILVANNHTILSAIAYLQEQFNECYNVLPKILEEYNREMLKTLRFHKEE